jgi:hypothetical protein
MVPKPASFSLIAALLITVGVVVDAGCLKLGIRRPMRWLRVVFSFAVVSAAVGVLLLGDEIIAP